MQNSYWFRYVPYVILSLFLGIMTYVVAISYTRRSGSAGVDIATIQKIRHDAFSSTPSSP
ncbi:MAG: hypothetical protein ACH350_07250 [Parachlamydiaceae bacterium]